MGKAQRDPAREKFWREALWRQKTGALTVRAFCAKEQLAETAFHAWRRILRQRDAERRPAPAAAPAFVPAVVWEAGRPVPAAAAVAADISIELRGGRVMRLPSSRPAEHVARLVRAIEGAA